MSDWTPNDDSEAGPPNGQGRGRHTTWVLLAVLVLIPLTLMLYKVVALDHSFADLLPRVRYDVTYRLNLDGHDSPVRVRTFVPRSDAHQVVNEEENESPGLRYGSRIDGTNRQAVWSGTHIPDGTAISHRFSVMTRQMVHAIDGALPVPAVYPQSAVPYLRAEDAIQANHPEIVAKVEELGADSGPVLHRVTAIYESTLALPTRPFKGTTDALTTLRLGEASCNGKSRLFVALARAADVPARLVGGLVMTPGSKRTSHQWVEVYVAGNWVPFDPTTGQFATLPSNFLVLYRGDESLFKHTADINFDYVFDVATEPVPSPTVLLALGPFNLWSLFERLGLSFALLRTLLMLPVGALVVVFFRNVVGLPTFGTFLPALIAAAASATGAVWGIVGMLIVVFTVVAVRWLVQWLRLLHSPTLAILLAVVTTTLLGTTLIAERFGLIELAHISLFPIAVLAITAERLSMAVTERGELAAFRELAGTIVVILACYLVMGSLALQLLVLSFPEVLLFVIAADVYLGRWVGIRMLEYLRFRGLIFEDVMLEEAMA